MRKIFTLLCVVLSVYQSKGQYFEAGFVTGVSTYIGDLQPNSIATQSYGLSYGATIRYHFRPTLTFRASGLKGNFYGSDRYARNNRIFRNLESRTDYYEGALMAEYNVGRYDIMDNKNFAPFFFIGVAATYFNPMGRYEGKWINLPKLQTEGVKYQQIIPAVPVGLGLKAFIHQRINLSIEVGMRYTMSDHLDDVSGNYPDLKALNEQNQVAAAMSFRTPEIKPGVELPSGLRRGDKYKNDVYFFGGVGITVNLASKQKMEFNPRYKYFWSIPSKK